MKKSLCHATFVTVISAFAAISLAACAMQTESDETGVDETNSTLAQETDPVASSTVEPEEIVVDETVIEVNPAALARARTLKVGVDHSGAVISIVDMDGNVLDEVMASDCSDRDDDYTICSFRLPAGEYNVEFGSVERYEAPESVPVNLKWGGTKVYGSYAEDPKASEPARPSLGLPGIGDQLAF